MVESEGAAGVKHIGMAEIRLLEDFVRVIGERFHSGRLDHVQPLAVVPLELLALNSVAPFLVRFL